MIDHQTIERIRQKYALLQPELDERVCVVSLVANQRRLGVCPRRWRADNGQWRRQQQLPESAGLVVEVGADTNRYPTGIKVSDEQLHAVRLHRQAFHGDGTIRLNLTAEVAQVIVARFLTAPTPQQWVRPLSATHTPDGRWRVVCGSASRSSLISRMVNCRTALPAALRCARC